MLLSSTTKELAEEDLPPGVTIRDLGERRLKDIDQPQHLYRLIVEGLQSNSAQLKTLDVDDRWLTIGSANLNEHSFFNDTEMNVVAHDPDLARRTRMRLWSEHLEWAEDEIPDDPVRAIDELWKPISEEQLERREAGRPLTHRVARLPHVSKRSARLLGPVNGMLVDG